MTNVGILEIEDLQLSYIGLKYDEASGTTTFYPVFTQVSSSTDGQIEPTEQTLVVEYTNIYYIDDQVNWRNCNLIANDMITSISTGNWIYPVLNILTQEDLSEYIRNEDADGVHYEYLSID